MEQTKSQPIINTQNKLYREYSAKEQTPLPPGIMPETKTSHTRLAYLDKSPANCPLSSLKEMWKNK